MTQFHFISILKKSYEEHPLSWILLVGVLLRLIASVFGGGYIASDDHFLVIHVAWKWLNGDLSWLGNDKNQFGHSLVYPTLHFILLRFFQLIGIENTDLQMILVRMLHAAWSLPIIILGYRFAERIHSTTSAKFTAWLLACLWIIPVFSVRQLGEAVSMLPLLYSLLLAEKYRDSSLKLKWLYAGLWLGFAFCLRYQAGFAGIGVFFALMILKKPVAAFFYTIGALLGTIPVGVLDWMMYGYPYANPIWYFQYNSSAAMYEYITGPWYKYILLILGVFIFPYSLYLLIGFFRTARIAPLMFSGTFAFLLIHSIIPNKQERFIATILPELVILGVIGSQMLVEQFQTKFIPTIYRFSYRFFWVFNLPLLLIAIFTYNKHAEIQSLSYLQNKTDIEGVVLDQRSRNFLAPWYYLGRSWNPNKWFVEVKNEQDFLETLNTIQTYHKKPTYVIIYQDNNLEERKKQWENVLGPLHFEKKIGPSLGDWILHQLNRKYNPSVTANLFRVQT